MDAIRQALIAEAATGKVRSNRLYTILIDLVDALQTQTPVEVQYVEPVVNPEAAQDGPSEADLSLPDPTPVAVKMFGRNA